jgi:hypothetical protein
MQEDRVKKTLIFLMVVLLAGLGSLGFGKETVDAEKLIIGKWIDEKGIEMEFKKDNKVVYFGKDEGTYGFLEKTRLLIKFMNTSTTYNFKFEDDNTLILTVIQKNKKKGAESTLKRMVN